jgi:hypothetical protein
MVVIKFDPTGQFIWAKNVGGTGFDEFTNVECDASGNVILVGYYEGTVDLDPNAGVNSVTTQGTSDLYVLKLSPEGETLWMHEITGTSGESTGGLSVTSAGNIYVSGGFNGTTNFSSSVSFGVEACLPLFRSASTLRKSPTRPPIVPIRLGPLPVG